MEKKFYIRLVLVAMLLFTHLVHSQELFLPDTSRWEIFINEDFNSPAITLAHYKDNNFAKKEGVIELPALLMDSNVYIQNETFTTTETRIENNIYAGNSVTTQKSQGDVIIRSGAKLKLKAQNNVFLKKGFEVEDGGMIEIKTNANN